MTPSILSGRTSAIITLLVSCVLVTACATIATGSHYDETNNFGAYKTFSWVDENPYVNEDSTIRISPLTQDKIKQEIQAQLERIGYSYSDNRDSSDFLIAYTVGTRDKIRVSSYPVNYPGSWGWHVYGSHYYVREVSEHAYIEGTLGVDIFDGKTNKPVWHGWAEKTISSSDRQNPDPMIKTGVANLFESFPR
jgi:hypothetical protein